MKVMLNTNTSFISSSSGRLVLKRFLEYQIGDIGLSTITLSELRYGASKSKHREKNTNARMCLSSL